MEEKKRAINWYPGHMTKARRMMEEDIKLVDLVIEIVDARIPLSSRNPDIDKLAKNKARIVLLNKSDLADDTVTDEWITYFKDKGFYCLKLNSRLNVSNRAVNNLITAACSAKIERDRARGIKNRSIKAMIVGIPNVGKSTFINSFTGRKSAKTGNKPGVTKGKQWIRINGSVELLDTPGILWPKIEDRNVGERLAMIGSINDQILNIEELALETIKFLKKNYQSQLYSRYDITEDIFDNVDMNAFSRQLYEQLTKEERKKLLDGKVDYLIDYPFTGDLMTMEAERFIQKILYEKLHAAHIVVGSDFSFGYRKRGDHQMLERYAQKYDYTVDVVEKARLGDREISSTYVREALSHGNIRLAQELLGYPYEMTGIVEHGRELGRTLGFPTMNVAPQDGKILPRYGVYACRVLIDGKWYGGVGNAGVKPTVTQEQRELFEVYVYDYEGDAYGKYITIRFLEFERPETRFDSVKELRACVMQDMRYGEEYFREHPLKKS